MKKSFYRIIAVILIIVSCIMNFETVKADENETIRVGIYQMEGFHSYNEYGDIEGYCIDYLNVVAGINRWTFEYVEVEDFMDGCNNFFNSPASFGLTNRLLCFANTKPI